MSFSLNNQKRASLERRKEFAKEWGISDLESNDNINPEQSVTHKLLYEPCTYENNHISLPIELFSLSKNDFKEIFNIDVFNSLDDNVKQELMEYLPKESDLNTDELLKQLFSGEIFHFNNPVDHFVDNLLDGEYNSEIVKYKNTLKILEEKANLLSYKKYHNKLLEHVLEQKKKSGLQIDEKVLDYYRLDADENDMEERREIYKARKRLERRIRRRKNEKTVVSHLTSSSSNYSKNLFLDAGIELSKSQIASIPDFADELIHSDDDMSSSTASLLSDNETYDFEIGSQESDEFESIKKKRKRGDTSGNSTPVPSTKRRKEKTRKEKRKSQPPMPFKNIYTLFQNIKSLLETKGPLTLNEIVDSVKDDTKALSQMPSNTNLENFLSLALNFMQNPPQFLESCLSQENNATEQVQPFIKVINDDGIDKYTWCLDSSSLYVDKVEELEKLFFFSISRNHLNETNDKIQFQFGKHMKSSLTIVPSTEEEILEFRRQEKERYTNPEKSFTYEWKGIKTTVAPLKKASAATRPHYLLKDDRPPYANLLALVRDSVARLPGGVGTRPDVAMLLKDSQFIKEDTKFDSLNSVVSGALDRLHSEDDPCVHYDNGFKLWINVHRQRNELDYIKEKDQLINDNDSTSNLPEDDDLSNVDQIDDEKMNTDEENINNDENIE